MTAAQTELLTIEQYQRRPDNDRREELVRGKVVASNVPAPRRGRVCLRIGMLIELFAEQHGLGQAISNDSGVVTHRDPDTLRGADVAFYSYDRLPRGPLPRGYLHVAPNVVFEVLSPDDRHSPILEKAAEYLDAGASTVCVADPDRRTVTAYQSGIPERVLTGDDPLCLDELPGFSLPITRLFE